MKEITLYSYQLWCGVIAAIIVFIVEIILCVKGIIFTNDKIDKKIKQAKENGHIVTAKLVKSSYINRVNDTKATDRRYSGKYKYTVDGIEYNYRWTSTSVTPPYTIHLYYINNPKKTFSKDESKPNPFQILLFIIPIVVAIVVMQLMSY